MRRTGLGFAAAIAVSCGGAFADDLKTLDLDALDQSEVDDFLGAWEIRDVTGARRCTVTFKREMTIGGSGIDVDPACVATFPIMDEITAWRLKEGWAIDLVDAVRQMRLRFEVPDVTYVASQDIDGIFTIEQVPKD